MLRQFYAAVGNELDDQLSRHFQQITSNRIPMDISMSALQALRDICEVSNRECYDKNRQIFEEYDILHSVETIITGVLDIAPTCLGLNEKFPGVTKADIVTHVNNICRTQMARLRKELEEGIGGRTNLADREQLQRALDLYYTGWKLLSGENRDLPRAAHLFQQSAELGHPKGQFALGLCYMYGRGIPQNEDEGFRFLSSAAENGNMEAQYHVSRCYASGKGCVQNMSKATQFCQLAADQGHVEAQFDLGVFYERGHGVEKNVTEALKYFRLAAAQGHQKAAQFLDFLQSRVN